MNVSHVSVMDLLRDPGNPLYAEPHSMADIFMNLQNYQYITLVPITKNTFSVKF